MNFPAAPKGFVPVQAYEELKQKNAQLEQTIAQLVARIEDLERRLSLNSSNSSKPPSSDGLKKPRAEPRTKSRREKPGEKSAGQKGHKGSTRCQTADPDPVEDHFPSVCGQCGTPLSPSMAEDYAARQVFDLPEATALGDNRTPGAYLPLWPLWRNNQGGVSSGGKGACTVRATHRRSGSISPMRSFPAGRQAGANNG